MAKYLVYIVADDEASPSKEVVAHVPALPGASARGQSVAEVKEKIKGVIQAYLRSLRDVGEAVPKASEGIYLEFEEVDTSTFLSDYDLLHPNEMESLMRWMAISRQELMDLVRNLPEEAFDWRADDDSPSVHEVLSQIAEADLWYTDRLKQWPEAPLYRLAAARGVALERLRALTEEERASLTRHEGEDWTPRKVMRRMLEHEREGIRRIRAVLATQNRGNAGG
ncbi:MAG: hypothetical protein ACE5H9_07665 [Anaerolineae bacterium]